MAEKIIFPEKLLADVLDNNTRRLRPEVNPITVIRLLAHNFGYEIPNDDELRKILFRAMARARSGRELPEELSVRTDAHIIVRDTQFPSEKYLTFEYRGREYNYGNNTQELPVGMRVPLRERK